MSADAVAKTGIVVIGRNEGERLRRCLRSALAQSRHIVYVDSGSSDGSPAMASEMGAVVVALDMSIPFTAARARNEGFARLSEIMPDLLYVQFMDGDCEMMPGWLEAGATALEENPTLAVVFGGRGEQDPDSTIYNKLCHLEWHAPIGEVKSCGGDAMMRASAFREAGGFDGSIIAGEEPELCVRFRQRGFKVLRIAPEMSKHDAAMTKFSQWWKRNVRGGHAYAQGAAMHGAGAERHWVKETRSNDFWGFCVPLATIVLAIFTRGWGLLLWPAAYTVLALKVYRYARRTFPTGAGLYTMFIVIGKIPQALGQMKYRIARLRGQKTRIIEYKSAPAGPVSPAAIVERAS